MNTYSGQVPVCPMCATPMRFFPAGVSKNGNPLSPSYRCPNRCDGGIQWLKDAPGGPQAAPQGGNGAPVQPQAPVAQTGAQGAQRGSYAGRSGGGFRPEDPKRQKAIMCQTALKCAVDFYSRRPEARESDVYGMAQTIYGAFLRVEAGQELTFPVMAKEELPF